MSKNCGVYPESFTSNSNTVVPDGLKDPIIIVFNMKFHVARLVNDMGDVGKWNFHLDTKYIAGGTVCCPTFFQPHEVDTHVDPRTSSESNNNSSSVT